MRRTATHFANLGNARRRASLATQQSRFLPEPLEGRRLLAAVVATVADAFVDSIGVNTHHPTPDLFARIDELGVRHLRDNSTALVGSADDTNSTTLYNNYGIKTGFTARPIWPIAQQVAYAGRPFIDFVEGPNEPDIQGTPYSYNGFTDSPSTNSYPATVNFSTDLYNALNANGPTVNVPVLAPSTARSWNARYLAGVPFDVQTMHSYPAGQRPTNDLAPWISDSRWSQNPPTSGTPLYATETGYHNYLTTPQPQPGVSEAAAGKYMPRVLAEYFKRGVKRTYLYELKDSPVVAPESQEHHFGLVRNDAAKTPKAAFTAVKNMIGMLDEGVWNTSTKTWSIPSFTPGALDYTINDPSGRVQQMLLQKSNGDFYLMLWQDATVFASGADTSNPTLPVSITLNTTISSASTYLLNSTTPTSTTPNPKSLSLNVPDQVLMVKLVQGTPPTPANPVVTIAATDTQAKEGATLDRGVFTVTRTGSTSAALTVNYTITGSATNGTDYTSLGGSVTIPIGSASATINVDPTNDSGTEGNETAILKLSTSGSYNLGSRWSDQVIIVSDDKVADFETGTLTNWTNGTRSSLAIESTSIDPAGGSKALKWTYNDDGATQWSNDINLNFTSAQNWSSAGKIKFRIALASSNISADAGKSIYWNFRRTDGTSAGSSGAGTIHLSPTATYQDVELYLSPYERASVNRLSFYLNGNDFGTGTHTFYIDNVTTFCDETIADFETGSLTSWVAQPRSTTAIETSVLAPGGGSRALRWTYNDDGATRWNNEVQFNLPTGGADWSSAKKLRFRFAIAGANLPADANKTIYVGMRNNGVSVGSGGAGSFTTGTTSAYRDIEIDLSAFRRDQITQISFYVDGNAFGTGNHVFYLDNIRIS